MNETIEKLEFSKSSKALNFNRTECEINNNEMEMVGKNL
jgi:hypothetical protein